MKTSKILNSQFSKSWGTGANLAHFHDVQLEGEPRQYNIGAKSVNPTWLLPGSVLEWEFKDEAKGSIKKAAKPFGGQAPQTQAQTVVVPASDPTEIRISTGLIVSTMLYVNGKIGKDQVDEMAVRIAQKFDSIKLSL